MILGNALSLTQMLTNLIENAIKYTNGVGTGMRVKTGCRERAGKRWAWVRVADDRPGIDVEHRAHLFDRFYRADPARSRSPACASESSPTISLPGGSGLGLSILLCNGSLRRMMARFAWRASGDMALRLRPGCR